MTRSELKKEYDGVEAQIEILQEKLSNIEESFLKTAKFKIGDIVKFEDRKGWIKEVNVGYGFSIEYKIGKLKTDGTPDKIRVLAYYKDEENLLLELPCPKIA